MPEAERRLPHAALDPAGRLPKAEKVAALLKLGAMADRRLRLLEIGTGSGVIAHYFATHSAYDEYFVDHADSGIRVSELAARARTPACP